MRSTCRRRRWRTRSRSASSEPGDEVVAETMAHVFRYELGGARGALGTRDEATPDGERHLHGLSRCADAVSPPGDLHTAPTRVVCLENTHNGGGGRFGQSTTCARSPSRRDGTEPGIHPDGARLMNAAVASAPGQSTAGSSTPSRPVCRKASAAHWRPGRRFQGKHGEGRRMKYLRGRDVRRASRPRRASMRSEHNVERLAEDHANARRLGEGLAEASSQSSSTRWRRIRSRRRRTVGPGCTMRRTTSGRRRSLVRAPQGRPASGDAPRRDAGRHRGGLRIDSACLRLDRSPGRARRRRADAVH